MSRILRIGALGTALSLLIAVGACTSEAQDGNGSSEDAIATKPSAVQMNDVSVLFPLAKTQKEFASGYLTASSPGAGGPLLPGKLYVDATGQLLTRPATLHPGQDISLIYDELRVVSFRVNPCFANIGPITNPKNCKNQLRLVFQPIVFGSGQTSAVDGAVHAFYSLTRDDLVELVKSIVALRIQEGTGGDLGPLAVHPILASQGMLGNEAKGLSALILKYAGAKNLVRFTTLDPAGLATKWNFAGFDVSGGKTASMVIPTLPAGATDVSFFAGFLPSDLNGSFTPQSTAHDNMQILGNLGDAQKASKKAQQDAFDAALRIENPTMHSPDTIDCASCHVAGPATVLTGAKLGLSAANNPNAFKPDPKFVSAANMKQTTPVDKDTSRNFHAFSYRDEFPMIAMRVINETASIVAYLNDGIMK